MSELQRDVALEVILDQARDLNGQLPADERLVLEPEAVLIGEGGTLDSLALINLLVGIEEELDRRFGATVQLVDAVADEEHADAFATLGSLAAWLVQRA